MRPKERPSLRSPFPGFPVAFLHVQPAENHNHSFHQYGTRQHPECGGPCCICYYQRWRLMPGGTVRINDVDKNVIQQCCDKADAERPEMWSNPFQRYSQKGHPQTCFVAPIPLIHMLSIPVVCRKPPRYVFVQLNPRARYCNASARCAGSIFSAPARSAIVCATLTTRCKARADRSSV